MSFAALVCFRWSDIISYLRKNMMGVKCSYHCGNEKCLSRLSCREVITWNTQLQGSYHLEHSCREVITWNTQLQGSYHLEHTVAGKLSLGTQLQESYHLEHTVAGKLSLGTHSCREVITWNTQLQVAK